MMAAEHPSRRRVPCSRKLIERLLHGARRGYNGDAKQFEVASGSPLTRRQNYAMQTEHGLRILRQWNPNSPCPLIANVRQRNARICRSEAPVLQYEQWLH